MRVLLILTVLFAPTPSAFAADTDRHRVEVYRAGPRELTRGAKASVLAWGERFLESANFNTADQPDVLNQGVTDIQGRYRATVRGDHLVVSYDRPTTFRTVAGDVTAVEIVVGLNRPDAFASALFTVDPDGRVVAHEKYAAMRLPPELAADAAAGDAR